VTAAVRVIPVLDLLNGVVVRGVAGQRESYRPLVSQLTDSTDPLTVARVVGPGLGLSTLYVADLDAIVHRRPHWALYTELSREVGELLVDAGVACLETARRVLAAGATRVIVGLESCPGPAELRQIVAGLGPDRVVFSLDLLRGEPLTTAPGWRGASPLEIAETAAGAGVESLIVLDLAQVGVGAGVSTATLCRGIQRVAPDLPLITGGGVRGPADLAGLRELGVAGVLVASALHDRRLTAADLTQDRG